MALDNLTPQVWDARLLRALETKLSYNQPGIVNRDYEGDISGAGDTVHINSIGDPTVFTYTKNVDMPAPETLNDADQTLVIDQVKAVNFAIDQIDKRQNLADAMPEAVRRAGYQLARAADSFMASKYVEASATNVIGTDASPITGTWLTAGTQAYDRLVDLQVMLDESDTPEDDRFAIVPSWYHAYLEKDNRFVGFGTAAQDSRLRNGVVGEAAGFTIVKSNSQVPNTAGTKYKVIAGHPMAWSFAAQIVDSDVYSPERRFAKNSAYKSLFVYGGKVVRPEQLAVLTGNKT